jgi:hypothetical protein
MYEWPKVFILKGSLCLKLQYYGTCTFSLNQAKVATSINNEVLYERLHEVEVWVIYFSDTNVKFKISLKNKFTEVLHFTASRQS